MNAPKPYDDALVDDLAKIFGPKVGTILVRAALDRLVELGWRPTGHRGGIVINISAPPIADWFRR